MNENKPVALEEPHDRVRVRLVSMENSVICSSVDARAENRFVVVCVPVVSAEPAREGHVTCIPENITEPVRLRRLRGIAGRA